MKIRIFSVKTLCLAALCLGAAALRGAHIGYLYPAGGRAGTTVEILVGGRAFNNVNTVRISGGGVKVLKLEKAPGMGFVPAPQKRYLIKCLKLLRQGVTEFPPRPEDTREWRKNRYYDELGKLTPLQRELVERNLCIPADPLQKSPSIANLAIVKLEIAKDAKPGRREFRLVGRGQISDPLPFYVDTLPEVNEPRYTPPELPRPRAEFSIPAVLNGQILPGNSDDWHFHARKGEPVTFTVRARALVPFLGDGVPGHFQAVLEVFNANGRLIASADDHHFDPDPELVFRAPADGAYTLRIRDALYRGREDFVYRIRARRGEAKFRMPVPAPEFGGPWIDSPDDDAGLALPAFLRFTLKRPGANARWRFKAAAGDRLAFEVLARRLGSPLDARLTVFDPEGKIIAECDDVKCPRIGTILHQADPRLVLRIPADGVYTAEVADTSGTGGSEAFCFFRIVPAEPDFELYAYPSGLVAATGAPAVVKVTAVRKNGFDGRIVLTTTGDSELRIVGANALEPGMDKAAFTVVSQLWRKPDAVARPVRLLGIVDGGPADGMRREAHAADEAMQAFAYTHLVPAERLLAMQTWGSAHASRFSMVDPFKVLKTVPGGQTTLELWCRPAKDVEVDYALVDPPPGIAIAGKAEVDGMVHLNIQTAENTAPGKYNLIVRVSCSYTNEKGKKNTERFVLPAVRMEVHKCPEK